MMAQNRNALLEEQIASKQFKRRLQRARLFERLGGGGILRKIARVVLTPRIYLPYVFYAKSGMAHNRLFTTTLFWGRSIQIALQDYDALALHMFGFAGGNEAELRLTKFLVKNLQPSDVFYDVGANCGFYTYMAIELCDEVHSFEPIAILANTLKANLHNGENVVVNQAVLSDTDGSADFYVIGSSGLSTLSAAVAQGHVATQGAAQKITVPAITIDEYVASHTKPTFLKLDAEGAEEQIIKGGSTFLSSNAPVIAMEIWGKKNEWELSMHAAERLRSMGYKSFRLDSEGSLQEAAGDLSEEVPPTSAKNFVFKK